MFIIIAKRSGYSVFGAATAPCKGKDGNIQYFETREDAETKATEYNSRITGGNVHYSVDTATNWF